MIEVRDTVRRNGDDEPINARDRDCGIAYDSCTHHRI